MLENKLAQRTLPAARRPSDGRCDADHKRQNVIGDGRAVKNDMSACPNKCGTEPEDVYFIVGVDRLIVRVSARYHFPGANDARLSFQPRKVKLSS